MEKPNVMQQLNTLSLHYEKYLFSYITCNDCPINQFCENPDYIQNTLMSIIIIRFDIKMKIKLLLNKDRKKFKRVKVMTHSYASVYQSLNQGLKSILVFCSVSKNTTRKDNQLNENYKNQGE